LAEVVGGGANRYVVGDVEGDRFGADLAGQLAAAVGVASADDDVVAGGDKALAVSRPSPRVAPVMRVVVMLVTYPSTLRGFGVCWRAG
jgi:hypothetical protein